VTAMTTTIVSILARKGGVAKTTTAANLAAGLAARGFHTLAADADAQGHLAVAFGRELGPEAARAFAGYILGRPLDDLILPMHGCPSAGSLLPGGEATRLAEAELTTSAAVLAVAARFRADVGAGGYDCAVIDSGPRGPLQDWAAAAADIVLVPAPCNYLGASAVFDALRLVRVVAGLTGHQPQAWVLPTMYEGHKKDSRFWLNQLRAEVRVRLLDPIPMRVKVAESLAAGVPLVSLAPNHEAAAAYMAVVEQIEHAITEGAAA